MKPKILCDFHHDELFESLRTLFEDRLGFEVYRPIGLEWYTEGYWMVFDSPATAGQYLGMHLVKELEEKMAANPDQNYSWLNLGLVEQTPGVYYIPSKYNERPIRAITLERFKETKFDYVLSSTPQHFMMYEKLIKNFQPTAKHIFQMGNNWTVSPDVKNVLNSTTMPVPAGINHVHYHQEFSLEEYYHKDMEDPRSIANLMHYMQEPGLFEQIRGRMPDWTLKAHGAGNPDGCVEPNAMAQTIRGYGFIWHVKQEGDGYGYNIHKSVACGKPIITRKRHFKGMTADQLLVPGVSCIDLDSFNLDSLCLELEIARAQYKERSDQSTALFRNLISFDEEEKKIRQFIDSLR